MGRIKVGIGSRFGNLVVTNRAENDSKGVQQWECLCDCGTIKIVRRNGLAQGTKSCGCLQRNAVTTHGHSKHKLYNTWKHILGRCYGGADKNTQWDDYGGRGIQVCEEWHNVANFIEWAENNGWEEGLEIDRINNDGDYTPDNCRFVTHDINRRNQRAVRKDNSSGYRGVFLHKNKWVWYVNYNKKRYYGKGYYPTKEKAALERNYFIKNNNFPIELLNTMEGD